MDVSPAVARLVHMLSAYIEVKKKKKTQKKENYLLIGFVHFLNSFFNL